MTANRQSHFFAIAILAALFAALGTNSPGFAFPFMHESASATVESGQLEGSLEDGLQVFKGIPYAQPPVGPLRWRAPRTADPWKGVFDATSFGSACPQAANKDVSDSVMSEDCLTLNIWSPAKNASERLPVMVWVHGGDFDSGSSLMGIYDGSALAKKGVIIVTINYRLGYFGFFGHPKLTEEAQDEDAPTANFGILDQIAALKWVKRNIAAFGGDAANVTLFGESAGGVCVQALMTSPLAKDLFQKAIVQSGGGRWMAPSLTSGSGRWLSAHDFGLKAAQALRIQAEDPLEELRNRTWQSIRNGLEKVPELKNQSPFIDGQVLLDQMGPVFERGEEAHVPLIVGSNSYEGIYLRGAFEVRTKTVLAAVAPILPALTELYPTQALMNDDRLADYIWGDANFVEPSRMIARFASRTGQPVYHYSFDFLPPLFRIFISGAPHGLDVVYLFGTFRHVLPFPVIQSMNPVNRKTSEIMEAGWTNFAKTGDPAVPGLVPWPKFAEGNEQTLVFSNEGQTVERDFLRERLDVFHGTIW